MKIFHGENRYDDLFKTYAKLQGLDWLLLKAQVKQESAFNPRAVSWCGAKGLSQFMPATWKQYGEGDPFTPEESIKAQAKYMKHLISYFKGDIIKAIAAYNCGEGRVGKMVFFLLIKLPRETQGYVKNITMYYEEYKYIYTLPGVEPKACNTVRSEN